MTEHILSINDASINLRSWLTDEAKGNMIIVHGLGEHGGRYVEFAETFNSFGYNVFAHDHQGHGKSSGNKGHIATFDHYLNDLKHIVELASNNGLPTHLLGHSLGGVIGTGFLIRHQKLIKSAIFTSPGFEKKIPPNALKAGLGKMLANLLPKLSLWNEIKPEMVCRTQSIVDGYSTDSLVHDRVSAKWFTSFLSEIEFIKAQSNKITCPVFMLISGSDIIINHDVSKEIFALYSSENKSLKEYPNAYHELLNEEDDKEIAFNDINNWLSSL